VTAAKAVAVEIHDKLIALLADVEELKSKEAALKADRARPRGDEEEAVTMDEAQCEASLSLNVDGCTASAQSPGCDDWRKAGAWMGKALIVLSGTGIRNIREWAPSAIEALRLVRLHMKLRRPGVRVEDERGNPVSFFQLKELAELEGGKAYARSGGLTRGVCMFHLCSHGSRDARRGTEPWVKGAHALRQRLSRRHQVHEAVRLPPRCAGCAYPEFDHRSSPAYS
jgi:hypothetical protein